VTQLEQKDVTKACAKEVTTVIMDEIRGKKILGAY
jgi:hypothetical protein